MWRFLRGREREEEGETMEEEWEKRALVKVVEKNFIVIMVVEQVRGKKKRQ